MSASSQVAHGFACAALVVAMAHATTRESCVRALLAHRTCTRANAYACDIHHFATVLSYPRCELRARARTRVLGTIEYTIEKRVTLERNNERSMRRFVNVNIARARDVEMLD